MTELRKIDGVKLWTDPDPARSAAIVIFQPGRARHPAARPGVDAARVICTTRTGQQNPGLRMSPHFYNTMDEIRAAAGFIRQKMKT